MSKHSPTLPLPSTALGATLALAGAFAVSGCAQHAHTSCCIDDENAQVVTDTDVEWGPLNPARGDQSPRAGTLWGDRNGTGATGFLVQFVDGFSSPPHIHNVTYRGVVIQGLVHNDDPEAAKMWMPAGSFWTQPQGESHITAASGPTNIAYIEIDEGPYLVHGAENASDNGERPINIDASNIMWMDASASSWIIGDTASRSGPQIAHLWGTPEDGTLSGSFVKLPTGFEGTMHIHGDIFHAVVIQGQPSVRTRHATVADAMKPGSALSFNSPSTFEVNGSLNAESIIYIRTNSPFEIESTRSR